MKLTLTHPARDWWPRLKALLAPAPNRVARPVARKPKTLRHHRTTAFFELP